MRRHGAVLALATALGGCATVSHPIYGVQEGRLAPCDGIAGCVSTQARLGSLHHTEPVRYASLRTDARVDLVTVLRNLGGNRVVSSHRGYLRAEFIVDEVIDDVEFYLPVDERLIHIRSVTRDGMADSGRHRARIEAVRVRMEELQGFRR